MWRIGLRNLRASRAAFALAFIAVSIGVGFVSAVLSLTDTFTAAARKTFAEAYEGSDLVMIAGEPRDPTGLPADWTLDESLAHSVAPVDGVRHAEGFVEVRATLLDGQDEPVAMSEYLVAPFAGSWVSSEALNPFVIADGAAPDAYNEIVIDQLSARYAGYSVGDRARVQSPAGAIDVTISGIARFGSAESPGGVGVVFFTRTRAQALSEVDGRVDQVHIATTPGADIVGVRQDIEALPAVASSGAVVVTGHEYLARAGLDVEANIDESRSHYLGIAAFAVVAAAFVIYTSLAFVAAAQRRQMALLRIVGASRGQVTTAVASEAAFVGAAASMAGWLGGIGVATIMLRLLDASRVAPSQGAVVINVKSALVALGVGIVVTLISTLSPAAAVFRLPPLAAVAEAHSASRVRIRRRVGIAGVLVMAAVVLVLARPPSYHVDRSVYGLAFGMVISAVLVALAPLFQCLGKLFGSVRTPRRGAALRLAIVSATESPKRVASSVAPVIVGVAIVSFTLVQSASARAEAKASMRGLYDSSDADYVIEDVDLPHDVADRIDSLPEVDAATGFSGAAVQAGGLDASMVATRPAALMEIFDIKVEEGNLAALRENEVAASHTFADEARLAVGDVVTIQFGTGSVDELQLTALYESHRAVRGDLIVTPDVFQQNVPTYGGAYEVWIKVVDGISVERAEAAFAVVLQRYPQAKPVTLAEAASVSDPARQRAALLNRALLALTIVVAIAGVANGAILVALDRRREQALLRAIGASKSQLATSLCWENVIVASIGAITAVVVAVGLALALLRLDSSIDTYEVPTLATSMVGVTIVALVALVSMLPARWAANRSIVEGLM